MDSKKQSLGIRLSGPFPGCPNKDAVNFSWPCYQGTIGWNESDQAKRLVKISNYLLENIAYYKKLLEDRMIDDRKPGWDELDQIFLNLIE